MHSLFHNHPVQILPNAQEVRPLNLFGLDPYHKPIIDQHSTQPVTWICYLHGEEPSATLQKDFDSLLHYIVSISKNNFQSFKNKNKKPRKQRYLQPTVITMYVDRTDSQKRSLASWIEIRIHPIPIPCVHCINKLTFYIGPSLPFQYNFSHINIVLLGFSSTISHLCQFTFVSVFSNR